MREIKFRAWDSANARMLQLHNISSKFSDIENMGFLDLPILQYTGLKDKNGKEIYEGDIVNLIPDGYVKELATVEWDYDNASWVYCRISSLEIVHGSKVYVKWKPVEVIGNIYENTELLKGGK